MKTITGLVLLCLAAATAAEAADVRLSRLQEFDRQSHAIAVNLQVDVPRGCLVDAIDLVEAFEGLLRVFGFRVAAIDDSELEFAVSIKGLEAPAGQPCGIRQLSMARQIPVIRMLRISPGSSSTRYRLWSTESIVTADQAEIQKHLQEQARKDVLAFSRVVN